MKKVYWYWKNIGDALLASSVLQQIKQAVIEQFPDAAHDPDIGVFWRQDSENGLHCDVNVYLCPKLAKIAGELDAKRCDKPILAGLECLIGGCDELTR